MANRAVILALLGALTVLAQDNAPPSAPITIGARIVAGLLIKQVSPVYPPEAKAARVQGTVRLQALIGKDGTIQQLTFIDGPALLVQVSMDAVKQWQYKPYLLNGEPTAVLTEILVNFVLK